MSAGSPVEHPRVTVLQRPAAPGALILLLHGGRADALEPPTRWNLPGLRMRPFARAVARSCAAERPVVAQVRYRHRGWNGSRADAARDAESALAALLAELGELPVVLVGHSMGGRAALHIAGHPRVRGVVGLAPWCPEEEPVTHLSGRALALVHDTADATTHAEATWSLAARARAAGARACGVVLSGSDHAMLRRAGLWHALAGVLTQGVLRPDALPERVAAALAPPGRGAPTPGADGPPWLLTPADVLGEGRARRAVERGRARRAVERVNGDGPP
ncbi:alpha/beta fold hydrolase [Streptomyces sp. JJ38]|uniref:alpha/beta fold hydrolase n=1 Tax=Streptomyces sp. JJ38 TaxID=2738128 RepID=UPI0027E05A1B|nr:alpha/beta fold hydrolase [Streptomyces sp. JJ38]